MNFTGCLEKTNNEDQRIQPIDQLSRQRAAHTRRFHLIPAVDFKGTPLSIPGSSGFFAKVWNTALLWIKGGEFALYAIRLLPKHSREIAMIDTFFRRVIIITNHNYMMPFLDIPRSGTSLLTEGRPWELVAKEMGNLNLLTSDPNLHQQLREILDPYFSSKAVKKLIPSFLEYSRHKVEEWIEQETPLHVTNEMANFATDTVIKILFQGKSDIKPAKAIDRLIQTIGYKMMHIPECFLNQEDIMQSQQTMNQLIDELLDLTNENHASSPLIQALRNKVDEGLLSMDHVRDSLKFFLFAGVETTSSLLASCLYSLARNPKIQDQLFAEMGKNNIQTIEDLNEEILSSCHDLTQFITQVLREHPPIWGQTRRTNKDLILQDDESQQAFYIPDKSALILLHAPIDKSSKTPTPLNFGAGVNACIGQFFARWEVRVLIATLVLKAKIEKNDQEPAWAWLSTHHIKGDYYIRIIGRDSRY